MPEAEILLELDDLAVEYETADKARHRVLDGVRLDLRSGEFVAVLGPSGTGKSSLVRAACGLIRPAQGQARFRGAPLQRVPPALGVVFQSPSLFPWLTVAHNIGLGLEQLPMDPAQKQERIAWAVDKMGLEGFEEAYPRELALGMRQRVALARALAARPEVLVLDEPFSGVDVLAAEALRSQLVSLWEEEETDPKAVLMATNDITEAALLANRIVVLHGQPARVKAELVNPLRYPRDPGTTAFEEFTAKLYDLMTKEALPDESAGGRVPLRYAERMLPLPAADMQQVIGLLEALDDETGDRADVWDFGAGLHKDYSGLMLTVNAAEILGLVRTPKETVELTELGRRLLAKDVNGRKALINVQLQKLKLFNHLIEMLKKAPEQRLPKEVLLEQLVMLFPSEKPNQLLNTLVNWGRFGELLGYKARPGLLYLDHLTLGLEA